MCGGTLYKLQVELFLVPVADQDVFRVGVLVVGAAPAELLEFYAGVVGVAPSFEGSGGAGLGAERQVIGGLLFGFFFRVKLGLSLAWRLN